jgi:DNA-3-methyladenine glycosylase I
MLILENFQAGLTWECVLNKREAFRRAFDGFDLRKVASLSRWIVRSITQYVQK